MALILMPFESQTSWGRYVGAVASARRRLGTRAPSVSFLPGWSHETGYHEALEARIRQACPQLGKGGIARLIFTAHAIPLKDPARPRYERQFASAAGEVAERLGIRDVALAYQSRPLASRLEWTGPDLRKVLCRAAEEGVLRVVVCPAGFPLENKEVRYDLDLHARQVAVEQGLRFFRAPTVGIHGAFVDMFVDRILTAQAS